MSITVRDDVDAVLVTLADLHARLDDLLAAELTPLPADTLLQAWQDHERLARRMAAVEHRLIAEAESRGLGFERGHKNTADLTRQLLRLTPADAAARVRAAHAAGPRSGITGDPLPPLFPVVAAAQARGVISPRHAALITRTISDLPDEIQDEHADVLEQAFVEQARELDPSQLARRARMVIDRLDPDGKYRDRVYRERRRELTTHRNADGSGAISGQGTDELMELLDVVFDSLAAPKPVADGVRDPHTGAQRRHDALLDGLRRLVSGGLPDAGGCPATLIVTITAAAFRTGQGCAVTGHGRCVPADEAIRWAGGDARVMGVVLGAMHEVTHLQRHPPAVHPEPAPGDDRPGSRLQLPRAATPRQAGPRPITSPTTRAPAAPASTTAPWPARTTTGKHSGKDGPPP